MITGLDKDYELPSILKELNPYLPGRKDDESIARFAIYHKSFADWLQDPKLRGTPFYVSPRAGHKRLAMKFLEEYARGIDNLSRYSLTHGPLHLGMSGEEKQLVGILTDPNYVLSVYEKLGLAALLHSFGHGEATLRPGFDQETVAAIASALRLSFTAVAQDPIEFEVQLEARLREVDALATFREKLRNHFSPDVLVPETNPLTPASGPLLFPLKAGFSVAAVCVYEKGRKIITGDQEGQLRVWWLESGVPHLTVDLAPMSFSCCESDPTRPEVVFGTFREGTIVHLNPDTGDIRKYDVSQYGSVLDFCIHPSQELVLSIHHKEKFSNRSYGTLICWSWPSLELIWKLAFKGEHPWAVRWNKDATVIYLTMWERIIRMDAMGNNQETIRKPPPLENIEELDVIEDRTHTRFMVLAMRSDETIALGRDDGRIEILEPDTGSLLRILPGHPLEFYEANISYLSFVGNNELVSAGSDAAIRIWNVDSGHEMRSFRATTSKIADMDVFDNGKKAVTGHKMLAANVWNLQASGHVEGEGSFVSSLRVCETLGFATAIIGHRQARIWNLNRRN